MSNDSNNFVVLMTDEHTKQALGCYGGAGAQTPNIDALAAEGTRFSRAYCPSPLCVPSRAAFATGRHVHETGNWDAGKPYCGSEAGSWGHAVSARGGRVTTVGKLHYQSEQADTGFPEQLLPLHVDPEIGGLKGLLRGQLPPQPEPREHVLSAGVGVSDYVSYDARVGRRAEDWIMEEGTSTDRPWVLLVSLVSPHYPLEAPQANWDRIQSTSLAPPPSSRPDQWPDHPVIATFRNLQQLDEPFSNEELLNAQRAYFALANFADEVIGRVVDALEFAGLRDRTTILYTSDHGEMLGSHGLWWKGVMYESSVGIPMILQGPGVPAGKTAHTPASLLDVFPTVLDVLGLGPAPPEWQLSGTSLRRLATSPDSGRSVLSQYHAVFSPTASFMLCDGRYKLVEHVGYRPQLFDLDSDPGESVDLAAADGYSSVLQRLRRELEAVVNPRDVDELVREEQRRRLESAGGSAAVLSRAQGFFYTGVPPEMR